MEVSRSPTKLATILTTKRKVSDDEEANDLLIDGNHHVDPKRVCTEEMTANKVSNETILRAITSLTDKSKGWNPKL